MHSKEILKMANVNLKKMCLLLMKIMHLVYLLLLATNSFTGLKQLKMCDYQFRPHNYIYNCGRPVPLHFNRMHLLQSSIVYNCFCLILCVFSVLSVHMSLQ